MNTLTIHSGYPREYYGHPVWGAMLADLRHSHLDDADAERLQLRPLGAAEMRETFSINHTGYLIPYFDIHGVYTKFFRVRFVPTPLKINGRPGSYIAAGDMPAYPYLTPGVEWPRIAGDPSVAIVLVEEEKTAAYACKSGLITIALGHHARWDEAMETLNRDFALKDRRIEITVPSHAVGEA